MSNTTISNGALTATIDSAGAELTSLALDGREYLWQADPRWWGRHAPVLFPIVGTLRDGRATSAEGPCVMGRHGIARLYEHRVVEQTPTSVTFEFTDTPQTREAYPYRFKLNMAYALTGPATLTQTFTVTNTGDVDLPFSVGGHPAFNVPAPGAGEAFEDYELVFSEPWSYRAPMITPDGLITYDETVEVLNDADTMPLTHDTFKDDAIMFADVPDSTITLRGRKSGRGVRVDFPGFDYIGVWSALGDAPFVALEPWTGHATLASEDDVFEHKRGTIVLAPGGTDERAFAITLL